MPSACATRPGPRSGSSSLRSIVWQRRCSSAAWVLVPGPSAAPDRGCRISVSASSARLWSVAAQSDGDRTSRTSAAACDQPGQNGRQSFGRNDAGRTHVERTERPAPKGARPDRQPDRPDAALDDHAPLPLAGQHDEGPDRDRVPGAAEVQHGALLAQQEEHGQIGALYQRQQRLRTRRQAGQHQPVGRAAERRRGMQAPVARRRDGPEPEAAQDLLPGHLPMAVGVGFAGELLQTHRPT